LDEINIGKIVITFVVFLFSTVLHELAHAVTAYKWGDTTARDLGRITLNPIPHMDPIGTVLMPLLVLFMYNGNGIMGWASTPVDKSRMRDPRWGDFWTSFAGPLTNLALAILSFIALKLLISTPLGGSLGNSAEPVMIFLQTGLWLNIFLMVLNLLPIPPLDGGHMLENLLPPSAAEAFDKIRPFGLMLLIAVAASGALNKIVDPLISWAFSMLRS
jgi:Zn-dependent protease